MLTGYGLTSLQTAQGQWVVSSVSLRPRLPAWQAPCGHQLTEATFQANQKP